METHVDKTEHMKLLQRRARWMRQNPTRAESILWERLRRRALGVAFRRQYVLYPYIVDLHCRPLRLVIEVDGPCHDKSHDVRRDASLNSRHGVRTLRFTNAQVMFRTERVVGTIKRSLEEQRASSKGPR
jgi:very-short-patch-repair endonuclease